MSLVPVDKNAVSVVTTLENAKHWLATAVEMTGPAEIAAAKAHIATAETFARELHLSRDIQLDAVEMVRRAEYALSKSIRKGQAGGTILAPGEVPFRNGIKAAISRGEREPGDQISLLSKPTPEDIEPGFYSNKAKGQSMSELADVAGDTFEAAIDEAKAEGNLTRANVVRKAKAKDRPATRDDKAVLISDLADQGYTSRQMSPEVGVSDARIREIARAFDIDIPADRMVGKARRIDHTAAVESAVTDLDNWASALSFIDFTEVDVTEADEWVASLTNSRRALNRFMQQIKETTHV